jgi:hypothetical protein
LGKVEGQFEVVDFKFLDLEQVWAIELNTCFVVKGRFEVFKPPLDGKMPVWEACTEEELDRVQPNWFESIFQQMNFFYGTLFHSSEVPVVVSCLNAEKYQNMIQKKKLCLDDVLPVLGVPSKVGLCKFLNNFFNKFKSMSSQL